MGWKVMVSLFIVQRDQQAETRRLDKAIWKNLKELGYGRGPVTTTASMTRFTRTTKT